MASGKRWIRLDTTWSSTEWVADLDPESRLCWIELLCHAKAHGAEGRVKALPESVAARQWGVTRNAVTVMVNAAVEVGSLVNDGGDWILTGWSTYQGDQTAAKRMKRHREKKKQVSELSTDSDVAGVTRNKRDVTPTETETETETDKNDDDARAHEVDFAIPRTGLEVGLPSSVVPIASLDNPTDKQRQELAYLAESTGVTLDSMLASLPHASWTKASARLAIDRYRQIQQDGHRPKTFGEIKASNIDQNTAAVMRRISNASD